MHPAPSLILFTSLSGLGFGLMFWLGLGMPLVTGWAAFAYIALAYVLAGTGLIFSTFHLGNPQRALKAFTQWQTSWLSREAWLAVLTMGVVGIYAFASVFLSQTLGPLGWIGAALALATVLATAMIYAQLKTIPRWHHWSTPLHFALLSLAGGALLANPAGADNFGFQALTAALLVAAGAAQFAHWHFGDRQFDASGTTMATATGLGPIGTVRAFEPPHTGTNYLLKEMVHVVGRKHAEKLRLISLGLLAGVPTVLVLLPPSGLITFLAMLSHLAGVLTARWLFYAQAEHVVGLYYGKR